MDERIAYLESLMAQELKVKDICVIGIWGTGGIGKTTIASSLYYHSRHQYKRFHFLANVTEECKRHGIINLKNKILSSLLNENYSYVGTPSEIPLDVKTKLRRIRALVVLDDISDSDQLENLVGPLDCLGLGSGIIVTTRDKEVLSRNVYTLYEVEPLVNEKALELFNLCAFKQNFQDMQGWNELSRRMVEYAKGLPLALKSLGTFLHGKSKEEWESQLKKLDKKPFKKIHDVLKLSYDSLDHDQQDIFLYIACVLKGYACEKIISLLDACGFATKVELKVLQDKALIFETKVWDSACVSMHDLIQEMGREIVREESIENLGKCCHLYDSNASYEVLANNMGTEAIRTIILDMSKVEELFLDCEVFAKMHKLKFLKFCSNYHQTVVHLPQGLAYLPSQLVAFHWECFPLKSLPSKFYPNNLVELDLSYSTMEKLWDRVVPLRNLKKIKLIECKRLLELPDLSTASNLKKLLLQGCKSLLRVHLSCPKLERLDLSNCESLTSLSSDVDLRSLIWLDLTGCSRLEKFSVISESMTSAETTIKELPSSIGCLSQLVSLNLIDCKSLQHLPENLCLRCLKVLNVRGCIQLQSLPELPPSVLIVDAQNCTSLEVSPVVNHRLNPHWNDVSVFEEWKSVRIFFEGCSSMKKFSLILENTTSLDLSYTAIKELPSSLECLSQLIKLNLNHCATLKELPSSLECLSQLKELNLNHCERLMHLPSNLANLINLNFLSIKGCVQLRSLPRLPLSLDELNASDCTSLETIAEAVDSFSRKMPSIYLANCINLDGRLVRQINDAFKEAISSTRGVMCPFFGKVKSVMCPGSEVLDWFVHKTLGASITIDVHSKPLMCSVCLILSPAQLGSKFYHYMVKCFTEIDDSLEPWYIDPLSIRNVARLDSDHMYLCCCLWKNVDEFADYPQKVSFRFEAYARVLEEEDNEDEEEDKEYEGIKDGIKACGVNILYHPTIDEECEADCSYDNTNQKKRTWGDDLHLLPPTKRLKPSDLKNLEAE